MIKPRLFRRRAFTLVELLVVISIIGVLVGLLLPAVQSARNSARKMTCSNNLKQLGLGAVGYHAALGTFPPAAPLFPNDNLRGVSWRVLILPYIDESAAYEQIDPVNGVATNTGRVHVPSMFCPAVKNQRSVDYSNYAAVGGAGKVGHVMSLEQNRCGNCFVDGIMFPNSDTAMTEVSDGASNTMLIGERNYVFKGWMDGVAKKGGNNPTRICSGASKNLRNPINADLDQFGYYKFDSSVPTERRTALLNDLHFGSDHEGGAQFAFADGSVHFLSETIDFPLLQGLATKDGGEPLSDDFR